MFHNFDIDVHPFYGAHNLLLILKVPTIASTLQIKIIKIHLKTGLQTSSLHLNFVSMAFSEYCELCIESILLNGTSRSASSAASGRSSRGSTDASSLPTATLIFCTKIAPRQGRNTFWSFVFWFWIYLRTTSHPSSVQSTA